jgi:hypothetical protein
MHRSLAELDAGYRALPPAPTDRGCVALIVRRPAPEARTMPVRVRLTVEEGVPGDDWNRRPPRDPMAQLAVMRSDVATLLGNGQPLSVVGDNLFVQLDLSDANIPAGSRLRVGDAVVEVTPKAHNGCRKFQSRFGLDAHRFVQDPVRRNQNLRGIYWRVLEPGDVAVGAPIVVLSRALPAARS